MFNILKQTMVSIDVASDGKKEASNDDSDASHTRGVIDAYAAIQYLENYSEESNGRSSGLAHKNSSSSMCQHEIRLDVYTDDKGDEIYYRLKRLSDNQVMWRIGPNSLENYSKYSEISCLEVPEDCYQFDIRDKGGDGISDGGGIEIHYEGQELYKGGDFGRGGVLKFGDCD